MLGMLCTQPGKALTPERKLSQFLLEIWGQADGLPHSTVSSITQTRDGVLWIATNNGLVRFNGSDFERFSKTSAKNGLRSNHIQTLLRQTNGNGLWIGTLGGGITRTQQGIFRTFTTREGLADDAVLTLCQHPESSVLWIGTTFGLSRWDGANWKSFQNQDGLSSERIEALSCHPTAPQKLWIGTRAGLHTYQDGKISRAAIDLPHPGVTAILAVNDTLIYVGTPAGLLAWNPQTQRQQSLSQELITTIYRDDFGTLWVGTQNKGLFRYLPDGSSERLSIENGLPTNHIRAIFEDREGGLWLGLERGGLVRLWEGKFKNFGAYEGLETSGANCLSEGKGGALWIGTKNGLFSRKNDQFQAFLPTSEVLALSYEPVSQKLFVGTGTKALFSLKDNNVQHVAVPEWVGDRVSALYPRKSGGIWLAGKGGVGWLKGQYSQREISDTELFNTEVTAIYEDTDSALWVGTSGGGIQVRYPNGNLLSFSSLDNLPGNVALCFQEVRTDSSNFMLIGTASGLAMLREGQVIDLSIRAPVLSNSIYGMVLGKGDVLWLTSSQGLFSVSMHTLEGEQPLSYISYNEEDGMRSSDCAFGAQPALLRDSQDRLWVPTLAGVSLLNLREIPINEKPPQLLIRKLKVDNVTKNVEFLPPGQSLRFTSEKERFDFYFEALSFEGSQKIQTRYRLEGFEEEWHESVGTRQATYTNLPPGTYVFLFTAANADGVWNLDEARLQIEVIPFFYERPAFRFLSLTFVLLLIAAIYYWRLRQFRAKELRLKRMLEEQTREAVRQDRQIRQREEEIARVDKIAHIINREVEFEQLFKVLLEQGVGLFEGTSRGFFTVFDYETYEFELTQYYGYGNGRAPLERIPFSPMMHYCHRGEVLEEDIYLIENTDKLSLFNLRPAAVSLGIPIKLEGRFEAMLFFEYDHDVELTDDYFSRLLRFKEHAVTAFDKSRYMKKIAEKNAALEDSFKRLSDSIQYAQRIQHAILPKREKILSYFPHGFILYKPRDIVSGDFYWYYEKGDKLFLASIDCTGHGVPGAFMTVMANSIINYAVEHEGLEDPAEILYATDRELERIFSTSTDTARRSDGMDMSLVVWDQVRMTLAFAGAKSPLYYIREGSLHQIKGSKFPIGNSGRYKNKEFKTHHLSIYPNDTFYIFTDGLPDQFGGDNGHKFLTKRFRDLLEEYHYMTMEEQQLLLEEALERWKGEAQQTDDILVIGFRF